MQKNVKSCATSAFIFLHCVLIPEDGLESDPTPSSDANVLLYSSGTFFAPSQIPRLLNILLHFKTVIWPIVVP